MPWYESQSDAGLRLAVFADRSHSRERPPEWMVQSPAGILAGSGVFPLHSDGDRSSTGAEPQVTPEPVPSQRSILHGVAAEPAHGRPPSVIPPAPAVVQPPQCVPVPDKALTECLNRSLEELSQLRQKLLRDSEEQLVALAIKIARRVVGRELSTDSRIVAALAMEGIEALANRDQLTVRVGPWMDDDDFESLQVRLQAHSPGCRVVRDPDLGPGGCVVETDLGRVDESLNTRLANIASVLLPGAQDIQW